MNAHKSVQKKELSSLVEESHGNIAGRFDNLDDHALIAIFQTSKEIGIYSGGLGDLDRLRTRTSGEEVPISMASLSKKTFYNQNWLAILCSHELQKDRPINYYGI